MMTQLLGIQHKPKLRVTFSMDMSLEEVIMLSGMMIEPLDGYHRDGLPRESEEEGNLRKSLLTAMQDALDIVNRKESNA